MKWKTSKELGEKNSIQSSTGQCLKSGLDTETTQSWFGSKYFEHFQGIESPVLLTNSAINNQGRETIRDC